MILGQIGPDKWHKKSGYCEFFLMNSTFQKSGPDGPDVPRVFKKTSLI